VRADDSVKAAQLIETTDPAIMEGVSQRIRAARFAPAVSSGERVSSWVLVLIRFRLG
jgi:hypothetical protein